MPSAGMQEIQAIWGLKSYDTKGMEKLCTIEEKFQAFVKTPCLQSTSYAKLELCEIHRLKPKYGES
ncbi:MAG: hypothetical protein JWQ71_355 [Pedosphaera sp.]|nr:hypothetical protein [Pedosphaera sp.]